DGQPDCPQYGYGSGSIRSGHRARLRGGQAEDDRRFQGKGIASTGCGRSCVPLLHTLSFSESSARPTVFHAPFKDLPSVEGDGVSGSPRSPCRGTGTGLTIVSPMLGTISLPEKCGARALPKRMPPPNRSAIDVSGTA